MTKIKHPFSGDDYICGTSDITSLETLFALLLDPLDKSWELFKIFENRDNGLLVTYRLGLQSNWDNPIIYKKVWSGYLLFEQSIHAPAEEGNVMILSYIEAKRNPKYFLQMHSDFNTNDPFMNGKPYKDEFLKGRFTNKNTQIWHDTFINKILK